MDLIAEYIECPVINYQTCEEIRTTTNNIDLYVRPGVSEIRLGVYVDDRMGTWRAYYEIRQANELFEQSGVLVKLIPAFVKHVDIKSYYDDNVDLAYDLEDWSQYDPFYEKAWYVDKHEADLVHVLLDNQTEWKVCGAGWNFTGEGLTAGMSACYSKNDIATADPDQNTSTEYIFAHEIGHQLGLQHDRQSTSREALIYGGHGVMDGEYGTIMSYAKTRVPYFSHPNLRVNGITFGDDDNNAVRAINAVAPTISLNYELYGPYDYPIFEEEDEKAQDRFLELLPIVRDRINIK